MKIVVLDAYTEDAGELSWDWLSKYGEYKVYARTSQTDIAEIIKNIGNANIAITNKVPVQKEMIDACPSLKMISVLATGYNIIDVEYAHEKGIIVSNVPAYSTMSTSQHAIALMLELTNSVGAYNTSVHKGNWIKSRDFCYLENPVIELDKKTLGIIGFGNIGKQTAKTAKALGMNVIVNTPHPNAEWEGFVEFCDLDTLFTNADFVVLHCTLNDDTKEIINKVNIEKMKKSAFIINDGRGGLVNEQDLADALNADRIAGAAVDVVSVEPMEKTNPLIKAKNCIMTPHIAWASKECRERIMQITEDNIKAFIDGNPINTV